MNNYERVLNKISPIFYKFINYRIYFSDNWRPVYLYLRKIKLSYLIPTYITIIKTPSYFLHIFRGIFFIYETITTYPTIHLYESYQKGKSFEIEHDEAIVDLILNNFSFEDEDHLKLFIALVGRDTYETIRRNIK